MDARLAANRYVLGEPHIAVDAEAVRRTGCGPLLVRICPAHCYAPTPDGAVGVDTSGCLECGACLAVAPDAVTWHHPDGGRGIAYRRG